MFLFVRAQLSAGEIKFKKKYRINTAAVHFQSYTGLLFACTLVWEYINLGECWLLDKDDRKNNTLKTKGRQTLLLSTRNNTGTVNLLAEYFRNHLCTEEGKWKRKRNREVKWYSKYRINGDRKSVTESYSFAKSRQVHHPMGWERAGLCLPHPMVPSGGDFVIPVLVEKLATYEYYYFFVLRCLERIGWVIIISYRRK